MRELEQSGAGYHSAFDDLDEFQRMTASEKVDGIALVFGQCDAGWAHQRFRATRPHWLNKHPRPRIAVYRGDRQRPLPTNTDAITIMHADQPADVRQFAERVREVAP